MASENEDPEEETNLLLPLPWLLLLYIVSMTLIVIGNALVVGIVVWKPHMRRPTNYLIMSLAISDLIIGLFVVPSR